MPKVSVIIPVYKAERFMRRCIDSLLNQTFKDFEIILVDDGSPDGSGKICDEYADKYSFIRSFHTKNGGVSSARNYGITQAQGEWICFVDSDDFVTENYLEYFFKTGELQSNHLYVQKGFYTYDSRSKKTEYRGITGDIPLYGANSFIQGEFNHILNSPWMKLFNRQRIKDNSLMFDTDLSLGEDHIFVLDYLLSDKVISVKIIEGSGYRYVRNENENSLTSRRKPYEKLFKYALESYEKRLDLVERYGITDENFLEFIKSETKTYRFSALQSLVRQSDCNWSKYQQINQSIRHINGTLICNYLIINKMSNLIIEYLPTKMSYLLFVCMDRLYCSLSNIIHKI